jgi:hypothetical protein
MVEGSLSAIFFKVPLAGDGPPLHVSLDNTAALKVRRSASIQLPYPPIFAVFQIVCADELIE